MFLKIVQNPFHPESIDYYAVDGKTHNDISKVIVNKGDLSHEDFANVYGGWASIIHLSDNPPKGFFKKPCNLFRNWNRLIELHPDLRTWTDVALSQAEEDIPPDYYVSDDLQTKVKVLDLIFS
jgi:hypothetical protein